MLLIGYRLKYSVLNIEVKGVDKTEYIRKPEVIHASLKELPNKSIIALTNCKIQFPVRYEEVSLAVVENIVTTVGYFAIIVEDKYYGICNILQI